MEENKIENNDSINVEQNETVENETTLTVDDYNKLKADYQALEDTNKKLYARVKKAEPSSKPLVNTDNSQVNQKLERLELQVKHGISDPEAIDFIMKNGGEKAFENPYIKGAVEQILQQKKAEAGVVADESGANLAEGKYTKEQLKAMPIEELEKILPHV